MTPISELHLRGLMARHPRSVLLRLWDGSLVFAHPDAAFDFCLSGAEWVITRSDLVEAGVSRRADGTLASGGRPLLRRVLADLAELGYSVKEPVGPGGG